MRKLLYMLLVPLMNFGQQTYVPDDAFEQALINFNIDPNPILDDSVPTAIINTIANLSITDRGILDLTGIEDFIYLDYLDCSGNSIEQLNLSSNTFLTYLACNNNNLTELNISENTELTHLLCRYNNLTELDVSNNSQLFFLHCQNNNLSCVEVWDVDYCLNAEEASCLDAQGSTFCFQKDENVIWSLDCNSNANIHESSMINPVLKSFNLEGKDATNSYFIFEIHENGSVKKYLKLSN